jgi:hypothetical protein
MHKMMKFGQLGSEKESPVNGLLELAISQICEESEKLAGSRNPYGS